MQQGENPVFYLTNFLRYGIYHTLNFMQEKSQDNSWDLLFIQIPLATFSLLLCV